MVFGIIITQVMLSIISFIVNRKNVAKWIAVFNLWWVFLLLLSTIIPFGGYNTSGNGEILIWIFLMCTTVGYVFQTNRKGISMSSGKELDQNFDKLILQNKKVKMLLLLFTLLLGIYAIRFSQYINSTNILNARVARYYVGGVFSSTIELLFFNYVIASSRFFAIFIIAYSVIYGRVWNSLCWLSIINLFLYSFVGGSRFPIVMLGVEIVILALYKKQMKPKKQKRFTTNWKEIKRKLLFIVCIFIVIFGILYFTAYRLGMTQYDSEMMWESFEEFYKQSIGYNTGPIAALDKTLEDGILTNHHYFGQAVLLNGIDEIFANTLSAIGISYSSARYVIGELASKSVMLGNISFNALYTCIFWFYSDMGIIGVIFYSLLFGILVGKVVRIFEDRPTLWSLMLNAHILYFFIMSNITWEVNTVDSLLYILFILFYFRKKESFRNSLNETKD